MMPVQWLQLPQEILLEILKYLSPAAKANVRATCSYLRTLVDHPSLWKHSTILFKSVPFNDKFWETLQNRKICSVELTKVTLKQIKKMTTSLPGLQSVTIDSCLKGETLQGLRPLTSLQQLNLLDCSTLLDQDIFTEVVQFLQLTQLNLCKVTFSTGLPLTSIVLLQNLFSLTLHSKEGLVPERAVQYILFRLPKLRVLSLAVGNMNKSKLSLCFNIPDTIVRPLEEQPCIPRLQLQKLELINSGCAGLSANALDQLSTLQTVNLCQHVCLEQEDLLKVMLQKLPNLTELYIEWSAPFHPYVHYLSSKLEKLSVVGTKVSNDTLWCLFECTSELKYLDLSFSHGFDEELVKQFPRSFPQLRNLYLSNTRLTGDTLVVLANLKFLRVLDVSNNQHLTPEVILAFRNITSNRIHLIL
ncbi:uncharacterized protein LOC142502826 [Ascaphus truei]|uniref:uncharacterized protein LOC142502826 n=1 Tax=Ascaphus truei TaxID=8439 RepID=UPI003F591E2D